MQNIYERMFKRVSLTDELIAVESGREALDYYKGLFHSRGQADSVYPELVFLDLNMPDMGGWEFLEEFENHFLNQFPQTKIVILTSSMDPEEKKRSERYSFVLDYFPKPLTFDLLDDIMKKLQ